jgi:chromosome segregation ATPase
MENPAEVQELRNKLRMLKFPQDEILNTVRRQQRAIHKQKMANETIRHEIVQYEAEIANIDREIQQHKTNEDLQHLQQQKKNLANKLSILTADYAAEETKRRKVEEEVSRANSRAGGLLQQTKANEALQARQRTMENRLDKALVRYNKTLARLADFRAHIDELRKDRRNFREVVRNADAAREKKDQEIGRLISDSNKAYSERDRRKMDLVRLRAAEKTDERAFEEKLARLNQTIEGQKIAQNHPVDQQQIVQSVSSQIGGQSDQQEELTTLTEEYQLTIQKTLDLLQFKDVEQLFSEAEALERENFSLFSFVQEHGAIKHQLQEEIDGLELQYDKLKVQTTVVDGRKSEELKDLTLVIQKLDEELTEIRDKRAHNEAEFESVYSEIENIFNLLGCSWEESPDGKTTASPTNAMFCLSLIEVALADMMNNVYEKTKMECALRDIKPSQFLQEDRAESAVLARGHVPPRQVQEKELAARVADSNRPLSLEEMRALLD